MNKKWFKSLFVKYFTIFFILFIFPVIIGGTILYLVTVGSYKNDISTYNNLVLKQTSEIINQKLSDIFQTIYKSATNSYVYEFITHPVLNNSEKIKQYFIVNELNAAQTSSDIIKDIILYSNNSEMIISSKAGTYDFTSFFKQVYNFNDMDTESWKRLLTAKSRFSTLKKFQLDKNSIDPQNSDVVIVASSLPLQLTPQGSILLFLDEDYFKNILKEISSRVKCKTFILNKDMEYITGDDYSFFTENNPRLLTTLSSDKNSPDYNFVDTNSKKYLLNTMELKFSGWKFIILSDIDQIYHNANYILKIFLSIIIVFSLAGVIVSYLLAKHTYKPIASIISKTHANKSYIGNELDYIEHLLANIINEKNDLKTASEESQPIIRQAALHSLLRGRKLINTMLNEKILKYRYDKFRAVIIRFEPLMDTTRLAKDIFYVNDHMDMDTFKDDWNNPIVLLNYDNEETFESCLSALKICIDAILAKKECNYFVYIGNGYNYIEGLKDSYNDALRTGEMQMIGQSNLFVKYKNEGLQNDKIIYTIDLENKLSGCIMSGDSNSTNKLLNDILETCLSKQITIKHLNRTIDDLISTLSRCISMLGTNNNELYGETIDLNLVDSFTKYNYKALKEYLAFLFDTLTRYVEQQKDNRYIDIYKYLVEYIEKNYHMDIYLDQISENLKLSSDYLRKIFKQFSGITFVDYLNKVRIEQSKKLLLKSDFKISDIGLKVGFDNINTFYKTFKKYEGMSPGQYAELKHKLPIQ
ncbi:MAG: hypothetical protein A2Y21_05405 [Clostridiales bacterium GWC2_40_7]|nr:MAG: hypothetical protein A2Y21_05405 [Clostridiales bacterium GWC2_40_7]